MGVDVGAARDGPDSFADGPAIFHDLSVLGQIAHGDFVAEGNIFEQLNASNALAFEHDRADARPFSQVRDRDADIVIGLVQKNTVLHKFECW